MQNLCVIPAKLVSKRLPLKNIKFFFGKPIIYYSIKAALESKLFSKVFVSTDSIKIAKISEKYGAEVDFLRPKSLASPKTPIKSVVKNVIKSFEDENIFFDFVCCLFPIAPMTTKYSLRNSYIKIKKSKFNFIFPATSTHGTNQHFFQVNNNLKIVKLFKKKPKKNFKNIYSDSGQFYWGRSLHWKEKNTKIIDTKKTGIIISKKNFGIDVNFLEDWKFLKKEFKKIYDN